MLDTISHFFESVGLAAQPIYLSPARNAWLDVVTSRQSRDLTCKHLIVPDGVGAWPDNGHVPPYDVEELGEMFVRRNIHPMRVTLGSFRVA